MKDRIVIIAIVLLALSGFAFSYRSIKKKQTGGNVQPLVTFQTERRRLPKKITSGKIIYHEEAMVTPVDVVRSHYNLTGRSDSFNEGSTKAMLYTMQRILNSPKWWNQVKDKSNNLSGFYINKEDVQLFKDAKFVLDQNGLEKPTAPIEITFETSERYINALNGLQTYDIYFSNLSMTF